MIEKFLIVLTLCLTLTLNMLTRREKFLIVLTMCLTSTFTLIVLTYPITAILIVFLILKHL